MVGYDPVRGPGSSYVDANASGKCFALGIGNEAFQFCRPSCKWITFAVCQPFFRLKAGCLTIRGHKHPL
jgi:hypothetical protein